MTVIFKITWIKWRDKHLWWHNELLMWCPKAIDNNGLYPNSSVEDFLVKLYFIKYILCIYVCMYYAYTCKPIWGDAENIRSLSQNKKFEKYLVILFIFWEVDQAKKFSALPHLYANFEIVKNTFIFCKNVKRLYSL